MIVFGKLLGKMFSTLWRKTILFTQTKTVLLSNALLTHTCFFLMTRTKKVSILCLIWHLFVIFYLAGLSYPPEKRLSVCSCSRNFDAFYTLIYTPITIISIQTTLPSINCSYFLPKQNVLINCWSLKTLHTIYFIYSKHIRINRYHSFFYFVCFSSRQISSSSLLVKS